MATLIQIDKDTSIRDSILKSTKAMLGIIQDYDIFDEQLIMLINTQFSTLHQLGVGPDEGFSITGDDETWTDYMGSSKLLNLVITFVHLNVRLLFDPPTNSYAVDAMRKAIDEYTWRINVFVDQKKKDE